MVNVADTGNQSTPGREGNKSADCPPDNQLPENSKENLDARLDHAIEETFPTSDPVSVTITKGTGTVPHGQEASPASTLKQQPAPEQDTSEHLLDQMRETLSDVAGSAAEAAESVYSRGERYVRRAGEYYPQAERYVREGQSRATRYVTGSPLLSLFMAGAIGYALAWMIHGERRDREPGIPDYGRTDRGYVPHRSKRRL